MNYSSLLTSEISSAIMLACFPVGEDGYTRFWSLKEGKQLYTIPPPCPVSRETVPCVQLSTHWGNKNGNLGLIMGLKNKFHYYGTLPLG